MGSSSSKVAGKAAAGASRRQYPSTSSILNSATSTSNAPSVAPSSQPPPSSYQGNRPSEVHPDPSKAPPSDARSEIVDLDGRDPDFGSALRRIGPAISVEQVKPGSGAFPTSSEPPLGQQGNNIFPSQDASKNPSIMTFQARERIGKVWEQERENVGRGSFKGRTLISAKDISEILRLRDEVGRSAGEIEKILRLQSGVVAKLGGSGVVANA